VSDKCECGRKHWDKSLCDLHVYIGSSVWREVEPYHVAALQTLLRDGYRYAYLPQQGDALMERTRGMSATLFMRKTKAEVWLSLDSDITGFTKEGIDTLVEQAMTHDIVVGAYICRSRGDSYPSSTFEDGTSIEFNDDPTPQPIKWGATGCMAVHRRVFEAMAETMPLLHMKDEARCFYPFFQTLIYDHEEHGKILLSEDFAFCERARELGFTTYVNPAIRLGHVGPYIFRLEDMGKHIDEDGKVWQVTPEEPIPMRISCSNGRWKAEGPVEFNPPTAKVPALVGD
jgi:hypothetical protein